MPFDWNHFLVFVCPPHRFHCGQMYAHTWYLDDAKVDDGLDNLQLNLTNIRQRFESGTDSDRLSSSSPLPDKGALQRSESLQIRMARWVDNGWLMTTLNVSFFHIMVVMRWFYFIHRFIFSTHQSIMKKCSWLTQITGIVWSHFFSRSELSCLLLLLATRLAKAIDLLSSAK